MTSVLTDAELFDFIVRITEDESLTKSRSIELIRRLIKITEDDE